MLAGKTLPPLPRKQKRRVDAMESILQEEYDADQEEQDVEAMDLGMKEGLKAAAEKFEELQIAEGKGEDKMEIGGGLPSPAGSDTEG